MRNNFVMRGKTASGQTEVLNFGKYKPGTAYKMTEFQIWPSTNIGGVAQELAASVTAGKTAEDPSNPNFNNIGLIAVAYFPMTSIGAGNSGNNISLNLVNDTFVITQNLILSVVDSVSGSPLPVNWQCRFESVKMSGPEEAAVNYKQFMISDE